MIKYRLKITKGDEIRYISHLDYASLMQRAICRAHLPAAYSEGFNPHMKIAFASALSVGVTSSCEYMDLELSKEVCQPELFDKLRAALPPGVQLLTARQINLRAKALMSVVDEASYEMKIPFTSDEAIVQKAIDGLNSAKEIIFTRETPKKKKDIEIKQYLPKPIQFSLEDGWLKLTVSISITPTGTVKPGEVLEVLRSQYHLPIDVMQAFICRTGLHHQGKNLIDLD